MYSNINQTSEPFINNKKNIIAGPEPWQYWNHSKGLEKPLSREEGPWPITGNIGSLLKQEATNNYANCVNNITIGSSPNCSGVFNPDIYTTSDTCGDNCTIAEPESYGIQSFGMDNGLTTSHALHAYKNVRAIVEGKGPSSNYSCMEWIPSMEKTSGDSCQLNYSTFENSTTGDWTKLPQSNSIVGYQYMG